MHDSGMYDILCLHIFGEGNEVRILKTRYPHQEGERVGWGALGLGRTLWRRARMKKIIQSCSCWGFTERYVVYRYDTNANRSIKAASKNNSDPFVKTCWIGVKAWIPLVSPTERDRRRRVGRLVATT